jgi:hypothetical protein
MIETPPIAIGGIGGSGTRLIAQLLLELGYHLGSDLNPQNDNLAFTLLFKRAAILSTPDDEFAKLLDIFLSNLTDRRVYSAEEIDLIRLAGEAHPKEWAEPRVGAMLARPGSAAPPPAKWGWKEPNTHIVIDRLYPLVPELKYIHVVRNGLDMAYSGNQRQARLWGGHFLAGAGALSEPSYSLKYWCAVHRRVLRIGSVLGGNGRFLFLNFDRLCTSPGAALRELLAFLEIDPGRTPTERLRAMIRVPESMGRHKHHGLEGFDPADVEYVRELGFPA